MFFIELFYAIFHFSFSWSDNCTWFKEIKIWLKLQDINKKYKISKPIILVFGSSLLKVKWSFSFEIFLDKIYIFLGRQDKTDQVKRNFLLSNIINHILTGMFRLCNHGFIT